MILWLEVTSPQLEELALGRVIALGRLRPMGDVGDLTGK